MLQQQIVRINEFKVAETIVFARKRQDQTPAAVGPALLRPRKTSRAERMVVQAKRNLAKRNCQHCAFFRIIHFHDFQTPVGRDYHNVPLKRPEHHGRRNCSTQIPQEITAPILVPKISYHIHIMQVPIKHGQCNEARKPEQHGQGVETQHGDRYCERREEFGREAKIENDKTSPDGDEDEERVLGWGAAIAGHWSASSVTFAGLISGRYGRNDLP